MNNNLDQITEDTVKQTENPELTQAIYDALNELMATVSAENGVAAMSVIYQGLQIWAMELAALEAEAAGNYLRALADLLDPPLVKIRKKGRSQFMAEAEARRIDAIRRIFQTTIRQIAVTQRANNAPASALNADRSASQALSQQFDPQEDNHD